MQTNREKFRAARARASTMLAQGIAPAGLSTCADCSVVLQETITGSRYYLDANNNRKNVCSDCYFDAFDEILVNHPLKSTTVLR